MSTVTAEQLADLLKPEGARISPDGKHVLYTLQRRWNRGESVQTSLWLAEVGKEHSAHQLTSGEYWDRSPEFSPDGRHISFISDRHSRGKPAVIYLLPFGSSGEALPLTPLDNERSINGYRWSPDSKMVAFISNDEKTAKEKEKEKNGDDADVYGEWKYARLRAIDVATREVTTLVSREAHVTDLAWSPDSKQVAYVTRKAPRSDDYMTHGDVHIVDCEDKASRELCCFKSAIDNFHWYKNEILFKGKQNQKTMQTSEAFWRIEVDTGKTDMVSHHTESCAAGLHQCAGELILHRAHGLYDCLDKYPGGDRIFHPKFDLESGWDVHGETVAYVKIAHTGGNVFSMVNGKETQLSKHSSVDVPLKERIDIDTKAEDGTPIDGCLYVPKASNGATVVDIHGGPNWRYIEGTEDFLGFFEWLLASGYSVLRANYRGGIGHGVKYTESIKGDMSKSYPDVISCVQYCIDQKYIKRERIAILGWSFGGYLTYLAVTRDKTFHFDAAVAGAGPTDLDGMATNSDIPAFGADIVDGKVPWLVAPEDTSARKASPIFYMNDIHTPLLILHGEKDGRVPLGQAWGFHRGMLARGKECEMVVYPREGHGFEPFERTHYVHLLNKTREFLDKHLNRA